MISALNQNLFAVSFVFCILISSPHVATCQAQNSRSSRPVQPYTAEFKLTTTTVLANGTTILRESKEIRAQDSFARTLQKSINLPPDSRGTETTLGIVHDPVDGTDTTWQSPSHDAVVQKLPSIEQRHGCWKSDSGSKVAIYESQPIPKNTMVDATTKPQVEELGTTIIEGIEARGQRISRTIPAGSVGNDQPLVIKSESWMAPAIGLMLRSITEDPRRGRTTRELVHLDLNEPDPAIFHPPADYRVSVQEMHQVPCEELQRR